MPWTVEISNKAPAYAFLLPLLGVVIGGLLSIFATIWSSSRSNKSKVAENELELKKSIYLEIAESLAIFQTYLLEIQNLVISNQELSQKLSGTTASIFKLHIIANSQIVENINAVIGNYNTSILFLMKKRHYILRIREIIDFRKQLLDSLGRRVYSDDEVNALVLREHVKRNELLDDSIKCSSDARIFLVKLNVAIRNELKITKMDGVAYLSEMTSFTNAERLKLDKSKQEIAQIEESLLTDFPAK